MVGKARRGFASWKCVGHTGDRSFSRAWARLVEEEEEQEVKTAVETSLKTELATLPPCFSLLSKPLMYDLCSFPPRFEVLQRK